MRRALPAIVLWLALSSSVASAQRVTLDFREDFASAALVGRVCEDRDGDGACGSGDPGIAKARVVLSDGTFASTDVDGRYHLLAVPARRSQITSGEGGGRDGYGRQLVKLELASLGRPAQVAGGPGRVLEFGPAALQTADFAVSFERRDGSGTAGEPAPLPRGFTRNGALQFLVTGRTARGHRVYVAGTEISVAPDGAFRAEVPLTVAENVISLADLSPGGSFVLQRQRVAVVSRKRGGVLFIPGPRETVATLELPPPDGAPAGTIAVPVEAAQGTRVRVASREVELGPQGRAQVELALESGRQDVAIEVVPPGGPPARWIVPIEARRAFFASSLLSIELGYDTQRRELVTLGRGAAVLQRSFGELELAAGVDVDVGDVLTAFGRQDDENGQRLEADPLVLLRPRDPYAVERALDLELYPPATADDGLSGSLNPSRSRLWARLSHPRYGLAELGSFHAALNAVEVGSYRRSLFGGAVDARLPAGPVTFELGGFAAPPAAKGGPSLPVAAHDELWGTGGSLFYLRNAEVIPGSEKLRIEVRDGITGVALESFPLERGLDYDVDYPSGRLLLNRPVPIVEGAGPLLTSPLQGHRVALVADYEHRGLSPGRGHVFGGHVGARIDGASFGAGAVRERRYELEGADYQLIAANGRADFGPIALVAEAARSEGSLFTPTVTGGFGLSDTGGLAYLVASEPLEQGPANALGLRLLLEEEGYGGQLWTRWRQAGFNDSAYAAAVEVRQVGGRAYLKAGQWELTAFADDRVGADPRDPFGSGRVGARDAALRASLQLHRWTFTAESHFAQLSIPDEPGGDPVEGGRLGLGVRTDFAVNRELSLNASHQQRLFGFGGGAASLDDSFSAAGFSWRPKDELGLSARGGWGPGVGTQVQAGIERAAGADIAYGTYTVDVDGPDAGRSVAVSGARRRVEKEAEVFAEDLFARDLDALRAGRAVGIVVEPAAGLQLVGRYERGVWLPFTGQPALLRDTGSARASWLVAGLRLGASAEVRHERGDAVTQTDVDRWQTLATLAVEARPHRTLGIGGRFNASKTRNRGVNEAQFLEGTLGAAFRLEPVTLLASWAVVNEFPAGGREARARRLYHLLALRPSLQVGERFRLGSGVHVGLFNGSDPDTVLAGSIRPSVRIVGGLEAAVEAARRSIAPEGEAMNAYRVELGYWLEETLGVAVGYNVYGFSGTGVEPGPARTDRIYLRLEAAY